MENVAQQHFLEGQSFGTGKGGKAGRYCLEGPGIFREDTKDGAT